MKFNQIIAPSMKELFIKEIEALILSGQLKVGDKLPTERELADEMKISRTIVNLGLSELKNKGFIDIVPRKGAFVADYAKNGKLDTLISIINFNGGRFDKKPSIPLWNSGVSTRAKALIWRQNIARTRT